MFNLNLKKMKNPFLTVTFIMLSITFCNAQKIDVEKVFGGYKYTYNDDLISIGDLAKIIESNTEAFELMKKGRTNRSLSGVLGFVGGGLVGWPIGTSIGGGNANWTLAAVGAGIIVVAIPIASRANKNINKAVELYNASVNPNASNRIKAEFNLIANTNGLGFSMNF
jgi:outer membrane lipoprotein SlyB